MLPRRDLIKTGSNLLKLGLDLPDQTLLSGRKHYD